MSRLFRVVGALVASCALVLGGSLPAQAADTGVVSEARDASVSAVTTPAHVASSVRLAQETSTDSLDPYIPPELSEDTQLTPSAVFGVDNRVKITDTTKYPYSAVVSIGDADSYWCSGSMVGEDVLITAAHCVVDGKTGKIMTNIVFRPGANGSNEPFGKVTAKKIIVGPEFKKAYDSGYDSHDDWAVVKLSDTVGKKTGYFGIKPDMPSGTKLTLTGYPADKFKTDGLSMWTATGTVQLSGEYFLSQIDMYPMQSGSPLYDASKYVGAVNIAENTSYNWHERITPDILTVVRAAKNNTSVLVTSVSVSGSTSVPVGGQATLKASIKPRVAENKAVTWKSSDTNIATVDANGKVTAKKVGTVTITATAKDGSKKSGSLKISVFQPVTSVKVSGSSTVNVGSSTTLKATVAPSNAANKAVSWKSSDTNIATVDANGKVTGKKAGTVTITATAKDGSKKSGSLKITVKAVPVSKVAVSGSSSVLLGKSVTLKATVSPSNATNKAVSWKSSDTNIATVDANGKVTGKKLGTVTITATAKDGSGKSGSLKVTVAQPVTSVKVSGSSSVMAGSSTTLKATVGPSNAATKAVTWKSSDTNIATVDANGKVTAKKVGTVTITATAKDGSGKSGSLKISVVRTSWARLWGQNQFDTMSAVSKAGFTATGGTVVIATSAGYQDALAANSIAGLYNAPILFVEPKKLPAQTKAELARLKPKQVIVAGGKSMVADNVLTDIQKATGVKPTRYWGQVASDTADALAKAGKGKWSKSAVVVTDKGYWDALSVGPYAYAKHAPIFYAQGGKKLSASTLQTMKDLGITKVYIIGGPYAVSTNVDSQIKAKGIGTQRIYGQTMINTSQKVAEFSIGQGMSVNNMGIATTNGYYDGLAAGPLLGKKNSVLVLTDSKDLSAIDGIYGKYKKTRIISKAYVFGGKYAVADSVYTYVNK